MEGVVFLLVVVESHDIDCVRNIERSEVSSAHCRSDWPSGIETLYSSHQAAGHLVADLRALEGFFVEDRPHENARVVPVAADHPLELANVFRRGVEIPSLIHHEHSHAVADLEEFGSGRVMRATNSIHTHFLELSNAEFPHRIRHRDAHAGVVLVDAHALDFERLVIEVKAGRSVKTKSAKSSRGDRFVENAVAVFEDGFHRIHGRRVHRPKPWIVDHQSELGRRLAEGSDFAGLGYRANRLSLRVKERDLHLGLGIFFT